MQCPTCSRDVPDGALVCAVCETDLGGLTTRSASPALPPDTQLLRFLPGSSFAGRFTIIERIGSGGMGVVYKAIDRHLHQEVALKLLPSRLARIPEYVERFRREVRVARQMSHPNVCNIHDMGESEGTLYLSMEWIRGETLRELLRHAGGRLDEARALEIAEKIAAGLQAAHERGVIHRDLKPGNVMIDDRGEVLVLDFGVASETGGDDLTQTNVIIGTLEYMSPEQRLGRRVDPRSDLYSLGLILEEMLTGSRRGAGSTSEPKGGGEGQGGGAARTPASTLFPRVSARVAPLLARLLAEEPERRFGSAAETGHALRATAGKRVGRVPAWMARMSGSRAALALWAIPLAILIVAAVPQMPRVADEIRGLFGGKATVAEINYKRGMHYLREESESRQSVDEAILKFRRAVEADSTHARAWAGLGEAYWMRFEKKREDASRQEANRAIQRAMSLKPKSIEVRNAYGLGLYMQGRYDDARKVLRPLTRERPGYDQAWANLGRSCRGSKDNYEEGFAALQRAIRLNPLSFRHLVLLGNFHESFGERGEAIRAYQRAIDLKPDSPGAWMNLGASYLRAGKALEAVHALQQSLRFEPDRAATLTNLGTAYYFLKEYDKAAENYRQAAAADSTNPLHYGNLGDALRMLGRDEEAVDAYRKAANRARDQLAMTPDDPRARIELALFCARARDPDCALREANWAVGKQPDNPEILFRVAVIRAVLGQDDVALSWLEKATRHGLGRVEIENDPDLVRFHADARFRRILELAG